MIVIIARTRKKIIRYLLAVMSIILLIIGAGKIWSSIRPQICITLEDKFSFNYPVQFKLGELFSNEADSYIETFSFLGKNMDRYKTFSSETAKISFIYPDKLQISNGIPLDGEIEYHININNPKVQGHGFIQVWNLNKPMKQFLEESKSYSQIGYISFKESELCINGMNGYLWDTVSTSNEVLNRQDTIAATKIHGLEVFLEKNNKMFRISYFLPEKKYNRRQKKMFMDIVNSFNVL